MLNTKDFILTDRYTNFDIKESVVQWQQVKDTIKKKSTIAYLRSVIFDQQ